MNGYLYTTMPVWAAGLIGTTSDGRWSRNGPSVLISSIFCTSRSHVVSGNAQGDLPCSCNECLRAQLADPCSCNECLRAQLADHGRSQAANPADHGGTEAASPRTTFFRFDENTTPRGRHLSTIRCIRNTATPEPSEGELKCAGLTIHRYFQLQHAKVLKDPPQNFPEAEEAAPRREGNRRLLERPWEDDIDAARGARRPP